MLIIDDEPELLNALRRALRHDLDLQTCGSAGEALERLDDGAQFDVIVTDLMTPTMSGIELYEVLKERFPREADATLFITGGAFTSRTRAFCKGHHERMLDKPISTDELRMRIEAMRDLTAAGPRSGAA